MQPDFIQRLRNAQHETGSLVCVGLDPDLSKIPVSLRQQYDSPTSTVLAFNKAIITATSSYVCAYKLNSAFYEVLGKEGFDILKTTLELIPMNKICLVDSKRGDIGNTASKYASTIFDYLNADACTVAPYMGTDAIKPFLEYPGCAAFILVRTSNPSGDELQSLKIDGQSLYKYVAELAYTLGQPLSGSVGFVVGATNPEELCRLRQEYPETPFLIPGIGAQGGHLNAVATVATSKGLVLVNSSRGIIYASDCQNFDTFAANAARDLRDSLNQLISTDAS
ncbi:MAG: orotidine-5'-phosphate decarboxylase [Bacteroidetes bacterium]|nr:orotidine-5'-phosphate decarboxylase [Bacteroidota bacterium]